jgi:flagellar basal body-associated protein FliL
MKGIILLVVGIVLLAAGVGGGWVAYKKYIAPPPESAEQAKGKKQPEPPPIYVRLAPFTVPAIGAERPEQLITFVIVLLVSNQSAESQVNDRMPRVMDTFLTTLYASIDEGEMINGSLVNVGGVKKRLQAACDRLLGNDVVKEVLVQTVLQRRF